MGVGSVGLLAGAFLIVAGLAAASGAGTVTFTQTFHNATETRATSNPCSGAPGTLTMTFNGVFHITVITSGVGAGTGWGTFTATGSFVFVPADLALPTFTGKSTVWDGGNFNINNFASTSILVAHGTGSDGSTLTFHEVAHITVVGTSTSTPSVVVTFDNLTCG